jgi:predicted amidophosphoribosyltransferase
MPKCRDCGKDITEDEVYCKNCNDKHPEEEVTDEKDKKEVAPYVMNYFVNHHFTKKVFVVQKRVYRVVMHRPMFTYFCAKCGGWVTKPVPYLPEKCGKCHRKLEDRYGAHFRIELLPISFSLFKIG